MDVSGIANIGLIIIFLLVLLLPFRFRLVEKNLEVFLFICGIAALTISGFSVIEGMTTGWSLPVVMEALTAPLLVTTVFGIPVGIVQIVLVVGLIFYIWFIPIKKAILRAAGCCSVPLFLFLVIVLLGMLSSLISAIIAALILVETVCALPLNRGDKITVTVVACFSIGLGAVLTPFGEPLSTITVSRLSGPPYYAGFDFLFNLLAIYIIPGVIAFGILGVLLYHRSGLSEEPLECDLPRESLKEVGLRALRVYIFIAALIFLGEGLKPLIVTYVVPVPPAGLYWVNMVSAVLDNATLAAAEINPALSLFQIKSALMGLVIAGGMLIPGNIPNIIAAGKIGITSREWLKIGVPLGLAAMGIYFFLLFIPPLVTAV